MHLPRVEPATAAIAGSDLRFPVRRIFCVGQNYADHVREMGGDPYRPAPFFFTKPADAVVGSGAKSSPFRRKPPILHHEVELVLALGRGGGSNIAAADAEALVFGHAVGIDLTRRDLQAAAETGRAAVGHGQGFRPIGPAGAITPGPPPADRRDRAHGEWRHRANRAIWRR